MTAGGQPVSIVKSVAHVLAFYWSATLCVGATVLTVQPQSTEFPVSTGVHTWLNGNVGLCEPSVTPSHVRILRVVGRTVQYISQKLFSYFHVPE